MKKDATAATAATETPPAAPLPPVPTYVKVGITPEAPRLRVVDAETGKEINRVIEADTDKGTVTRYAVEHGNFVREGSDLKTITEERKVRLEWIEGAA